MFLISGITGNVGGAAARVLLDQGHALRALVRDPAKAAAWAARGVELIHGSLEDAGAITRALDGVAAAFVMIPPNIAPRPGFPEARAQIASYQAALRNAPPPRLVVLSSVGSQQTSGLGLITVTHLFEQALAECTMPKAVIRPGSFLENYAFALDAAAATGWFDTFLTPLDRPVPLIASDDIGREVARWLTAAPWTGTNIVELGTRQSPVELARALSEVTGRNVQPRAIPRAHWSAVLEQMGWPAGGTAGFEEMEDGVNRGWIDFGVEGTLPVASTITPAKFFADLQAKKARGGSATG